MEDEPITKKSRTDTNHNSESSNSNDSIEVNNSDLPTTTTVNSSSVNLNSDTNITTDQPKIPKINSLVVVSKYFKQNKPAVAPKSQFGNVENSDVLATKDLDLLPNIEKKPLPLTSEFSSGLINSKKRLTLPGKPAVIGHNFVFEQYQQAKFSSSRQSLQNTSLHDIAKLFIEPEDKNSQYSFDESENSSWRSPIIQVPLDDDYDDNSDNDVMI